MVEESADRRSPVESSQGIAALIRRLLRRAVPSVSAREAHARLARVVVVDVRERHEYRGGHIPGARHIALGELRRRLDELDRERPLITVCRSGNRSRAAAEMLAAAGYQVENLSGGMLAWARERLPVQTGKGQG